MQGLWLWASRSLASAPPFSGGSFKNVGKGAGELDGGNFLASRQGIGYLRRCKLTTMGVSAEILRCS